MQTSHKVVASLFGVAENTLSTSKKKKQKQIKTLPNKEVATNFA